LVNVEAQSKRYDIKLEKRYFLGEKIPVNFTVTNIGPRKLRVKDIAMSKISMKLRGPINDEGDETRKYTYDGRRGVFVPPPPETSGGDITYWYAPTFVKKPDVFLRSGQSISINFDDLLYAFFIEKGVAPGVYTLMAWFDDRQQVTKKFKVEVEEDRTYERLMQMLRTGDETTMNWASYYMFKIDEKRALSVLRAMLQSDKEAERVGASRILQLRGYINF
jgi:hypothetical protein